VGEVTAPIRYRLRVRKRVVILGVRHPARARGDLANHLALAQGDGELTAHAG